MSDSRPQPPELSLRPIGVVHSPHRSRLSAPRQPAAAREVEGVIELHTEAALEHGLADLHRFSHIWLLFWFHLNQGFRAKVAPPRSQEKRGVFATRSPYRPNPIGMSLLRLLAVEGRCLRVRGVDVLDGTPVLDLKPYLPYADRADDANSGWLEAPDVDPAPTYAVEYTAAAGAQLDYLTAQGCAFLRPQAETTLRLGPAPHPYRRIRHNGDGLCLGVRDFRVHFTVHGQRIVVHRISSGYRTRTLRDPRAEAKAETPLAVHRDFISRFGAGT